MIDLFGKVTCPVLGLSSLAGVLYKYMENMKKIVSGGLEIECFKMLLTIY